MYSLFILLYMYVCLFIVCHWNVWFPHIHSMYASYDDVWMPALIFDNLYPFILSCWTMKIKTSCILNENFKTVVTFLFFYIRDGHLLISGFFLNFLGGGGRFSYFLFRERLICTLHEGACENILDRQSCGCLYCKDFGNAN